MSIDIYDVRGLTSNSARTERRFKLVGTNSIAAARSALIDHLDGISELDTYNGHFFSDVNLDETGFKTFEARVLYAALNYSGGDPLSQTTFDTTGSTRKITRGLQEWRSAGAPIANNLIGINSDLTVEGIEVPVRQFDFEIRVTFTDEMTNAYQQLLAAQTGTVNNAEWNGYAKGSVLFRGCRGAQGTNGTWDLGFAFSHRPNPGTITVPGYTTTYSVGPGPDTENGQTGTTEGVEGWFAVWTYNQPHGFTFDTKKVVLPVPVGLYVTRVLEYSNYDLLNVL